MSRFFYFLLPYYLDADVGSTASGTNLTESVVKFLKMLQKLQDQNSLL